MLQLDTNNNLLLETVLIICCLVRNTVFSHSSTYSLAGKCIFTANKYTFLLTFGCYYLRGEKAFSAKVADYLRVNK
jgi:hypothetical protein